ncbi:diaminopimelate decarboxylase [Paenibacillus tarimensis]
MENALIQELAQKYGTPLFIYDLSVILKRIQYLTDHLHPCVKLFYSLKANPNPTLVYEIHKRGIQLEVCSLGEYRTAVESGGEPRKLMYLGPGKTEDEIIKALDSGVGYYIVESLDELYTVIKRSAATGKHVGIGLRVNPAQTIQGSKLKMGGVPSPFGIDEGVLDQAIQAVKLHANVSIKGLHVYYGTRILKSDVVIKNTESVLTIAERKMRENRIKLEYLGIGGGLGIPYHSDEQELDIKKVIQGVNERLNSFILHNGPIQIIMELGRYLVADAGVYISSVIRTKTSRGIRYVMVDGGTHHFAAAGGLGSLLKKNFSIDAIVGETRGTVRQMLAGPLCTPDDILGRNVELPVLSKGDLIRINRAGAYGLTASPAMFLSHRLPREILVWQGNDSIIRNYDEYNQPVIRPVSL